MLDRIRDCICHPKIIGRYNRDKIGKILLFVLFFFFVYVVVFGVRTFTENPLEGKGNELTSLVISKQDKTVEYDSETFILTGDFVKIETENVGLYVLPNEDVYINSYILNVVLEEDMAYVYFGDIEISSISYKDIQTKDFSFENISSNESKDILYFKMFIEGILESSYDYFRMINFVEGVISTASLYLMLFLVCFLFARMVNPTIEGKVRAKLVLYDNVVFLVFTILASLFNQGWLAYVAYSLPMIYTMITFRHIVRVVVPKNNNKEV